MIITKGDKHAGKKDNTMNPEITKLQEDIDELKEKVYKVEACQDSVTKDVESMKKTVLESRKDSIVMTKWVIRLIIGTFITGVIALWGGYKDIDNKMTKISEAVTVLQVQNQAGGK